MEPLYCLDAVPQFLGFFDLSVAPRLLFYSYIPSVLISLVLGFFVFTKDKRSLRSKLFLALAISFALWVVNILLQWTAVEADVVYFGWQLTGLLEVAIYLFSLYFAYVIFNKNDSRFGFKVLLFILALPVIIALPTEANVAFFDLVYCEGSISWLWNYIYVLEIGSIIWIGFIGIRKGLRLEGKKRYETLLLAGGMITFLTIFTLSNLLGYITFDYEFNLIGPSGLLIFLAVLSYTLVKYRTFNIKVASAQILVAALWVTVFSLLFVQSIDVIRIVTSGTLILVTILGWSLLRIIRRDVEQRERLEKLTNELAGANKRLMELSEQKSEFLSIASHQFRGPLTAIKGYSSLLLEGSFGNLEKKQLEAIDRVFKSAVNLELVVEDFLNLSRIEEGKMQYSFEEVDARKMVIELVEELRPVAEEKGLTLSLHTPSDKVLVRADKVKLSQVILNLIDNSIKYTETGRIDASLQEKGEMVRIMIEDTGVGISPETLPTLFQQFKRAKNANKVNVKGTGLGLYIAKNIIEAHKGRIWAESEGEGHGSRFIIELSKA